MKRSNEVTAKLDETKTAELECPDPDSIVSRSTKFDTSSSRRTKQKQARQKHRQVRKERGINTADDPPPVDMTQYEKVDYVSYVVNIILLLVR